MANRSNWVAEVTKLGTDDYIHPLCEADLKEILLPQLLNKVFHVTSYESFRKIRHSGSIQPNANDQFPTTYYRDYYGKQRGYVCLIDLRFARGEDLEDGLMKFFFLAPGPLRPQIAFLVLRPTLYRHLIDWQTARADVGFRQMWIPYIECWHPGAIPMEQIQETHFIEVAR